MAVYLLHFDKPYHHARHYLGFTTDLGTRIALHKAPTGSSHHRLMQVIYAAGIGFTVARVWPDGDRELERSLKRRKGAPRLCPICQRNATLVQCVGKSHVWRENKPGAICQCGAARL